MLGGMRRRTTAAVAATAVAGVAAGAATAAVGRRARSGGPRPASSSPRPAGFARARLTVHATAAGRITLTRTPASQRPGVYGITSPACHAVIGAVLDAASGDATVVRRLERVTRGELRPGTTVTLTPQLHQGDPRSALGIGYADAEIPADVPGERSPVPAWFVPGPRDTWIIALHGLGAGRELPLNLLPFLNRQRFPVLVPGHRAAPGRAAPAGLGPEDWRQADAALRYAVRYGARRVVLYGWSSGATMALHAAARSPLRGRIGGLVLDSPVLDPAATLRALAVRRGVPRPLARLAPLLRRAGDAARGGPGAQRGSGVKPPPGQPLGPRGAPLPVLILHGPGDTVAPFDASQELAARHPESIVLHTVRDAEHAAMWNAGPTPYEEALRRFLTPLT